MVLTSCTQNSGEGLQTSTSSVTSVDSVQNSVIEQLTEIHQNLELIRKTQGLIGSQSSELGDQRGQILEDISLINALLLDNQKKIELLTKQQKAWVQKMKP